MACWSLWAPICVVGTTKLSANQSNWREKTMDSSQKKWSFKWKRLVRCVDGPGLVLAWPRYLGVGCVWVAWPRDLFFWWESLLSKFGRRWWISFKMTVSWNYIYVYMFKTFMPPNWPPKEEPPAFMLNMQQINLQLWQPNDRKHQWQLISHSRTLLIFLNKRGQIPFQVVRKAGSIISASGDGMGDDSLLSLLEVLIELALAIWLSQDHCLHTSNQIWKWKICSKVWESTDYERWQF